jgi:F-type H+-transporting ATPase subunit alpha
MKKVAGTLKLDQAQFRELEAFAKFGSDLDASTKLTIERGRRNLEILKQPQFSPVKVEDQVAIIYAATNGLLDNVPVEKVRAFEVEFRQVMQTRHPEALQALKAGKLDDSITNAIRQVAKDLSASYAK